MAALEYDIFTELRERIAREVGRVQATAQAVAACDALCSLAETAAKNNYCMPELDVSGVIDIRDGRHPVVEKMQTETLFVPNDTVMDTDSARTLIITGPNMAGKSTYMRQTALIVLMAQMGSFVPAKSARIGLVDRVFTRIGAIRRPVGGQIHLYGGDDGGGRDPEGRHGEEPHHIGRDRTRHVHLRRHGHRPRRSGALRGQAEAGGQDAVLHALP